MEEFDLPSLDSSGMPGSAEAPSEKSEKQRESYKKAQSQLQKAQKDEQKAKGDNTDLFEILLRFIQNPYYESFIVTITSLLQTGVPARYILIFISLIYPEAALHILTAQGKKEDIHILLSIHRYEEQTPFHEHDLHPSIRAWMNAWVSFSQVYLVNPAGSTIMQSKLLALLESAEYKNILTAFELSIGFFFQSRNIDIHHRTSASYASFIVGEHISILKKTLVSADQDLLEKPVIEEKNLFGL